MTFRTLTAEQIRACPHFIMDPDHYDPDGRCRCTDPDHDEMAEWGYTWMPDPNDPAKGRWV